MFDENYWVWYFANTHCSEGPAVETSLCEYNGKTMYMNRSNAPNPIWIAMSYTEYINSGGF